jgi:hypothetical protein
MASRACMSQDATAEAPRAVVQLGVVSGPPRGVKEADWLLFGFDWPVSFFFSRRRRLQFANWRVPPFRNPSQVTKVCSTPYTSVNCCQHS